MVAPHPQFPTLATVAPWPRSELKTTTRFLSERVQGLAAG